MDHLGLQKNITGIILAGGESRRMGRDKGLILLDGKTFIAHIIEALLPLVGELFIVSDKDIYNTPYPTIKDVMPNCGPLGGLYSGLQFTKTKYNLVLSCDVPLVTTDLLSKLLPTSDDYDVVQFERDGKEMPLVALYKKECEAVCLELLQRGEYRLMQLTNPANPLKTLKTVKKKKVVIESSDKESRRALKNINTPKDLEW